MKRGLCGALFLRLAHFHPSASSFILPPSSFILHPWIPMPVNVPLIPFLRRRRRRAAAQTPTLVLVSAVYLDSPRRIRLAFVRAIDIAALDGSQIFVDDGNFGVRYVGTGPAALFDPAT